MSMQTENFNLERNGDVFFFEVGAYFTNYPYGLTVFNLPSDVCQLTPGDILIRKRANTRFVIKNYQGCNQRGEQMYYCEPENAGHELYIHTTTLYNEWSIKSHASHAKRQTAKKMPKE